MSLMRCEHCEVIVDTDAHPEAFVRDGVDDKGYENWVCLCLDCRDRFETEE